MIVLKHLANREQLQISWKWVLYLLCISLIVWECFTERFYWSNLKIGVLETWASVTRKWHSGVTSFLTLMFSNKYTLLLLKAMGLQTTQGVECLQMLLEFFFFTFLTKYRVICPLVSPCLQLTTWENLNGFIWNLTILSLVLNREIMRYSLHEDIYL